MNCSVILCTHNPRPAYLQRVLDGLAQQTLDAAQWEFLIIDNASKNPLEGSVDLSFHQPSRMIREETVGLTAARLRGIRESTSKVLVFIDDDNVLAPDYLTHVATIDREWPVLGTWGGQILPGVRRDTTGMGPAVPAGAGHPGSGARSVVQHPGGSQCAPLRCGHVRPARRRRGVCAGAGQ
jgi:GT2 family glycosyltransferase